MLPGGTPAIALEAQTFSGEAVVAIGAGLWYVVTGLSDRAPRSSWNEVQALPALIAKKTAVGDFDTGVG